MRYSASELCPQMNDGVPLPEQNSMYLWIFLASLVLARIAFIYVQLKQVQCTKNATLPDRIKRTSMVSDEKFETLMKYNYQKEYLELMLKYMSLLYDFAFFACGVPVYLWNTFSHTIFSWNWCTSDPAWTEFLVSMLFMAVWLVLQKVVFLPFRLISTFVIEEQAGYNKIKGPTFFSQWIVGTIIVFVMYWSVVILALTLIKVSGEYLILSFAVATFVISILMVLIYPIFIAPLFNDYEELKEGDYDGIRERIIELSNNLNHPLNKIYLQIDSQFTEHSNASVMGHDVYLSDNLFKHHEDRDEILAIVAHEICHAKNYDLYCSALVDVLYMVIYATLLSVMVTYGNPIVASFGFTYQSTFVSLFLFQSIFIEVPDFFLRLFIHWNFRRQEYTADRFAAKNDFNEKLQRALLIMFIRNDEHLAPNNLYTLVYKDHPNINQRIQALDDLLGAISKVDEEQKNINQSDLREPLLNINQNTKN